MSLALSYCQELARELRQIAVYLPGVEVATGDIISFKEGNFFGPKPIGPFQKVANLTDLNIQLEIEEDQNPYSYVYASKGSVNVSFSASASAGTQAEGKLAVNFSKEGATYLSAVGCKQKRFKDISSLDEILHPHKTEIDWKQCFVVIAVTVAARALIMQSNTSSASLEMEGQVKGLQPIPGGAILNNGNVNANINLKINSYKEASFIKDWSDNVAVFFQLVRYKKKLLGGYDITTARREHMTSMDDPFLVEVVDPLELVG
jgi:hypothetical protein